MSMNRPIPKINNNGQNTMPIPVTTSKPIAIKQNIIKHKSKVNINNSPFFIKKLICCLFPPIIEAVNIAKR